MPAASRHRRPDRSVGQIYPKGIDFLDAKKVTEKLNQIAEDVKAEKNIHNRAWLLDIIEKLRK